MIPIRRYPYTDFHDLNLDFLLRQFSQYEDDIDDLKKRVKILEDWRIIIDGDITIIKGDITTIKGDIITIKGDIVDIKSDIVDIKGDIIDINITIGDHTTRIKDLEDNIFRFWLQVPAYSFSTAIPAIDPDYPYSARINLTNPTYAPHAYEKFVNGDFSVGYESQIIADFLSTARFFSIKDKLCSHINTGLNQITLYAKEQIAEPIDLYCTVFNERMY